MNGYEKRNLILRGESKGRGECGMEIGKRELGTRKVVWEKPCDEMGGGSNEETKRIQIVLAIIRRWAR
jgi:hypothetical protein